MAQSTEIVEEIHFGDIGTILESTIKNINSPVDISSATTKNILLQKPSGAILTKAGNFTTDGTDGLLDYTTISGDLDESGVWQIQAHVILGSGDWHSDIKNFSVFPNLS
jgi:hypothetical protein